jgi:hypothetical protein
MQKKPRLHSLGRCISAEVCKLEVMGYPPCHYLLVMRFLELARKLRTNHTFAEKRENRTSHSGSLRTEIMKQACKLGIGC